MFWGSKNTQNNTHTHKKTTHHHHLTAAQFNLSFRCPHSATFFSIFVRDALTDSDFQRFPSFASKINFPPYRFSAALPPRLFIYWHSGFHPYPTTSHISAVWLSLFEPSLVFFHSLFVFAFLPIQTEPYSLSFLFLPIVDCRTLLFVALRAVLITFGTLRLLCAYILSFADLNAIFGTRGGGGGRRRWLH